MATTHRSSCGENIVPSCDQVHHLWTCSRTGSVFGKIFFGINTRRKKDCSSIKAGPVIFTRSIADPALRFRCRGLPWRGCISSHQRYLSVSRSIVVLFCVKKCRYRFAECARQLSTCLIGWGVRPALDTREVCGADPGPFGECFLIPAFAMPQDADPFSDRYGPGQRRQCAHCWPSTLATDRDGLVFGAGLMCGVRLRSSRVSSRRASDCVYVLVEVDAEDVSLQCGVESL